MAGEVHPVPSRTRKLSPPAPMVLRSQSVGEQDVADQRGAFSRGRRPGGHVDPPGDFFLASLSPARRRLFARRPSPPCPGPGPGGVGLGLGRGRLLPGPLPAGLTRACGGSVEGARALATPPHAAYITSSRRAPPQTATAATRANLENRIPRSKRRGPDRQADLEDG